MTGRLGWAMLGAVYLFWGSTFLSIRVLVQQADPLAAAGVRFAIAGALLLLGLAVVKGIGAIRCARRDLGILTGLGLLHFLFANGLVSIAEQSLASGSAALLFATVPLCAVGMQLGGGDPARAFVSAGLGLTGVMLVVGGPLHTWGRAEVMVLVAAAGWALAGILARRLVGPHIGAARASAYQMLTGGLALLLAAIARGENLASVARLDGAGIVAMTHLVLLGSLAGFFAYQWCLTTLPWPVTTSHAYVNPIVALILGAVVLHEPIGRGTAAGALVVCLAVALCLPTRPAPTTAVKPLNRPSVRSLTWSPAAPPRLDAKESLR
ncbi:MAG: EamA family transporter [Tetrasphaera sp.]